jgi:hypothetical protein
MYLLQVWFSLSDEGERHNLRQLCHAEIYGDQLSEGTGFECNDTASFPTVGGGQRSQSAVFQRNQKLSGKVEMGIIQQTLCERSGN